MMFVSIRNRDKSGLTFALVPNTTGIVLYNDTGAAVVKGDVLKIGYSTTASEVAAGKMLQAQAVATDSVGLTRIVIALEAMAIAAMGYFALEGQVDECNCYDSAAITLGQSLKPVNAKDYFVLDHATPTLAQTAIAMEAYNTTTSTEALKSVWLIGREVKF
jgi:hypothetical protein